MDPIHVTSVVAVGALQSVGGGPLSSLAGPTGAAVVFVLTVFGGGVVLLRGGRRLDRGVDALLDRPLSAIGYGLAAYVIAGLLTWYAFSQLSLLPVDPRIVLGVQFVLFAAVLSVLGGFGFAVVGAGLSYVTRLADPWLGLVVVSAAVAVAWSVLPVGVAAALWFGVAAVGLGGATRRWIHSTPHDGVRDE